MKHAKTFGMNQSFEFQESLKSELRKRCSKNTRYSLRAFSKALGVDAPALSRILAGKKIPSRKLAQKIIEGIDFSPTEQERFWKSLYTAQRSRKLKDWGTPDTAPKHKEDSVCELNQKLFDVISDWYHYAILELTFTEGFRADPRWIAKRLQISQVEAKLALERLEEVGLLKSMGGRIKKVENFITTADHQTTSPALKRRQKQILEKSERSLENDPVELRNHTSITMAIDPKKIPEAKRHILEFGRWLCKFLESGHQKEVYEFSMNLFPLSKRSKEK